MLVIDSCYVNKTSWISSSLQLQAVGWQSTDRPARTITSNDQVTLSLEGLLGDVPSEEVLNGSSLVEGLLSHSVSTEVETSERSLESASEAPAKILLGLIW